MHHSLLTRGESSQFVFALPTAEQCMLKPLVPFEEKVLENGVERFLKASLKVRTKITYNFSGRENLTTNRIPCSTF